MHGSPSLPPGFANFAAVLRRANASRELVRNRRFWPLIYSTHSNDSGNDTEVDDVCEKSGPSDDEETEEEEELWEEKAIESTHNEPSAMTEDDSDQEENHAMPSRSNKPDQDPFAHWDSGEQLQCDLVDCSEYREANDGTRYLFCCIDVFSKYAWA